MPVFSFYIFDRHTECIYSKSWLPAQRPSSRITTSASDDAKLIFGTVFSLRNMVRKLGGDDDAFISYRTGQYKLHYYETPANLRLVLLTDTASPSMRNVLHQIYINLWVEYGAYSAASFASFMALVPILSFSLLLTKCASIVVKNPLAPVEHKGGEGVKNELFELGLDQFIRGLM
ncbi:Transport protein particle subunit [Metarhizium brunneum]|uniref:Trafficking protein particle complex subunit n=1 Tax=Metarhizium brunneum TaxID=500148 RepID=A0A7D5YRV7_9HYPO